MAANAAYSIDYANEITKLDPQLFSPQRLSIRVQSQMHARSIVIRLIGHQCMIFSLFVHHLRLQVNKEASTRIGIIGGGRVGVEICQILLMNAWPAHLIAISTRQPQDLRWMARVDERVSRYYDNAKLVDESDILILAMPPSQLTSVGIQIKHTLGQATCAKLVISVLAGVELEKVCKVCACSFAIHTRVHPSLVDTIDSSTIDGFKHGATHWAYKNSSGLRDLCFRYEQLAQRLYLKEPRLSTIQTLLGPSPSIPFIWTHQITLTQQIFSSGIDQLDVPYQDKQY
ncbi:hypothetical protein THRCLA_09783 [Thraustotheca clavata]|uniref:Pyrroline-5-carboxylate reductase catalytic N-terminal domain-containing protein n=1 Tax=Thraustotheca clavata TaxID=74557 RepID=A0A1V9YU93_9STRA|nr:hypothetical protein THRCLA_09783 [Thraustotheca clavata]